MAPIALVVSMGLLGLWRLVGHVTEPSLSSDEIHQVVGESARETALSRAPGALSVVTWNIERGQAFDGVLDTLRRLDADIYLLQEVDMFCRRSGGRNVAQDLAVALGMNWVFGGEFQEIGERRGARACLTGQAILSRHPIEDSAALVFEHQASVFRWRLNPVQPRRGGRMALRARSAGLLLYNAHLESGKRRENLRRRQLLQILDDERSIAHPGMPVVVAGDFNNRPAIRSAVLTALTPTVFEDALRDVDEGQRGTSVRRSHPIDWIFVKHLSASEGQVADWHDASDHHPVAVRVERVQSAGGG